MELSANIPQPTYKGEVGGPMTLLVFLYSHQNTNTFHHSAFKTSKDRIRHFHLPKTLLSNIKLNYK